MTSVYALTADAYGFYEDGTEAGSVQIGSSTTPITRLVSADSNILVRIRFSETGAGTIAGAATDDYKLQRSLNSTTVFADVTTTSTVAKVFTTSALTDAGATTNRLGAGGGAFVAGQQEDGNGEVTNYAGSANNFTEHVFAVTLIAADVAEADVIRFRVLLNNATTNMTYTAVPTINVTKAVSFTANTTTGPIVVTGQIPSLILGSTLAPAQGTVTIAGQTAILSASATMATTAGAIALAGYAPDVPQGLTERLAPNAVLAGGTNLRDTLTNSPPTRLADIDEPTEGSPGPDAEWWTAINPEGDIDIRLGFPTSSGNLVGTQTLKVLIRGTSLPSRDYRLDLYENGAPAPGSPTVYVTGTVNSIVGQVVTLTFQPSDITDVTGAGVELRIRAISA